VLKTLVDRAGWHYLIASALAFSAGAIVTYMLSVRCVFRFRRQPNPAAEFATFFALGLVGLLVNAGALFVAVSVVGLGLVTAKLLAACCTFATNFTLRRQFLFSSSRVS
jgi:putative flippase GtrA